MSLILIHSCHSFSYIFYTHTQVLNRIPLKLSKYLLDICIWTSHSWLWNNISKLVLWHLSDLLLLYYQPLPGIYRKSVRAISNKETAVITAVCCHQQNILMRCICMGASRGVQHERSWWGGIQKTLHIRRVLQTCSLPFPTITLGQLLYLTEPQFHQ